MKTSLKYWTCILLSFGFAAGIPLVAVFKKFPLWREVASPALTIGAGGVIAIIVVALCFGKILFPAIKKKLGITSTPAVFFWLFGLIAVEILSRINTFMTDIKGVILAGLVGSAIGWVFSLASVHYDRKMEAEKNGTVTKEKTDKE